MNKFIFQVSAGLALSLACQLTPHAQGLDVADVFTGGEGGYHTYRIPGVATTREGTILAFAEGRVSRSDHARNDIVLKRSMDDGATWNELQVISEDGKNSLNNPCVVVIPSSNRILLMFQRYPARTGGERGVEPGHTGDKIYRNMIIHSDDDGKTWSSPRDITSETKRPTKVTSVASGPGNGIVLRHGQHKGRIIFPFNQGPVGSWNVYAVFSDDHGTSWSYGEIAENGSPGMGNEVLMAELSDGRVRLNSRSHDGRKMRKTAVSEDGGVTWSKLVDVPDLPEPQCNAGFFRFSDPIDGETSRLIYTGPNSQEKRVAGTVHISYDEGATWTVSKEIIPGNFAYSALTRLNDGRVGCLFETGEQYAAERISFARFGIGWITNGADRLSVRRK